MINRTRVLAQFVGLAIVAGITLLYARFIHRTQ